MSVSDFDRDLSQRSEGVIRITFRIVPSKDGGTSSEARTAWDQFPPGPRPILPAAIPPRRYPDIRNNDVSFPLPSEAIPPPGILTVPVLLSPFRRIDPAITTFGSTESELTGRPVPLSRLVHLRTVGPLQKLGRPEFGSLPDLTQFFQRLSHLDVTQPSEIMRFLFPLHSERFHKVIARVWSGSPLPCSIRNSYPLMLFLFH